METKQIIETFFEDHLGDTSKYFLYKDKQLLKEGHYVEFAEEQIKKARNIALSISGMLFFISWYGIISLIEYGADPHWLGLTFGLTCWLGLAGIVFYASKEYYTIKSSMSLFIKMMNESNERV